jgi:drug/metabolite transporter (DMT)-like permease
MNENRSTAFFLLIVLSVIWGTSFILIKKGLAVFSPVELAAIRISVAGLVLLPLAWVKRKEVQLPEYKNFLFVGLIGIFVPAFLFGVAQTRLDSSLAGALNSLSPVWTLIVGAFFFKQRFRGYVILGIIISFAGAMLLSLSRGSGFKFELNPNAYLIVLACAMYGANVNFIKFNSPHHGSVTITSMAVAVVFPLGLVILFGFTDFITKLQTVPGAWMALGYLTILAVMSTAVANLLFNKLIKIQSPVFAASVTYIMPLVSVTWGVLDGEVLQAIHVAAMALILGGVYLANRK